MIALALAAALLCGLALAPGAGGAIAGLGLSGAMWSAGLLLFGLTGAWSDGALLLLGAAIWWWRGMRLAPAAKERLPRLLLAGFLVLAAIVSALFVEHSIRYPDGGWDARAIWNLRARGLYGVPGRLAEVFSPDLPAQHSDYPLLLPGLIAHFWFAAGARTPLVPIAISAAFAIAGVVLLERATSAQRGRLTGFCAALLLLGTPDFLTLAWNQYADLKLAVMLLLAVVLATEGRYAAAGLVAGLVAFTKNEGLLEAGALVVAVLVRAGPRQAARLALGALAPLALLAYFKLRWAPPNDLIASTSLADVAHRAPGRIGMVGRGFLEQLIDFSHWGCALAAIAAAWVVRWPRRERGHLAPLFAAFVLPAFFAIYLVTPLDVRSHLESSLDRLLFQLWPSMLYACALALLPAEPPPP